MHAFDGKRDGQFLPDALRADGQFEFEDTASPPPARYYRTVYP
jgi:hypothetical protein